MEPQHERIARIALGAGAVQAAVIAALEAVGYKVSVIMSAETFTRLTLTDPADGTEEKIELSVDWRAHDPVQLAIGPVLHADDAVANKVCALFADALGALTQITDAAFAEYRTDPGMIADMRHRFAQWRRELLAADPD
jgi:hypothetical protein